MQGGQQGDGMMQGPEMVVSQNTGSYGGYIGIMEKKMETTILCWVILLMDEIMHLIGALNYCNS